MSEHHKAQKPRDLNRIGLKHDWEISYWTQALGVDEKQLKRAVKIVGNSVDEVQAFLGNGTGVSA
jgi:hypothetical protein